MIDVDETKKNYELDISCSPYPNIYPVIHVSALELSNSLVPAPTGDKTIIHILGSRKQQNKYQYLVSYKDYKQEWMYTDIIDDNSYYTDMLKDYQYKINIIKFFCFIFNLIYIYFVNSYFIRRVYYFDLLIKM